LLASKTASELGLAQKRYANVRSSAVQAAERPSVLIGPTLGGGRTLPLPWLFWRPRPHSTMSSDIRNALRRRAGLGVNPQLFRHAIAKIIVKRDPGLLSTCHSNSATSEST
jgi:hypothetical protein